MSSRGLKILQMCENAKENTARNINDADEPLLPLSTETSSLMDTNVVVSPTESNLRTESFVFHRISVPSEDGMSMKATKTETTVASVLTDDLTDDLTHSDLKLKLSNQKFNTHPECFTDNFGEKSFLFSLSDDSDLDPNWIPTNSSSDSDSSEPPKKRRNIEVALLNPTELQLPVELEQEEGNELTDEETVIKCPLRVHSRQIRKERQELKNSGKSYTTAKGINVPQKKMVTLKLCRMKCKTKMSDEIRAQLFNDYWKMKSHDRRVSYIASLISVLPKSCAKTKVCSPSKQKKREHSYKYNIEVNGERTEICKHCFLAIFDESEGFIRMTIKNKLQNSSGITASDKRGIKEPPNKTPQEKIDEVKKHIQSFPAYESHYSRRHSNKKYLSSDLTLTKMHEMYTKEAVKPCSFSIYSKEFKKLNLKFKKPKLDTCNKCDVLRMKAKVEQIEETKDEILRELTCHIEEADLAYQTKSNDKEAAKIDETKKVYSFDLQQCLPTPHLETSVAFYKRSLWTYNLTIHDCITGQPYCYMWHEGVAGRGANQVASCLYHFLKNKVPQVVQEVTFYSDTCGGQNKNSHVAAMFLTLLSEQPTIKQVNHKFLVAGHTHLECDVDHAAIEKRKKKHEMVISVPYDWYQLVRTTGKKKKFEVIVMTQDNFFNFAALLKQNFQIRKKNIKGELFSWHSTRWLMYNKEFGNVFYKTNFEETTFDVLNFSRKVRGKRNVLHLEKCYTGPLPISSEKKRDIISLLPLVDPLFHKFYQDLNTNETTIVDYDPDLEKYDSD